MPLNGWWKKHDTEARTEPQVRFLGEQDGPSEREFTTLLRREFVQYPEVKRAYLGRVAYGQSPTSHVALCIASHQPNDEQLLKKVASVFSGLFNERMHLDTLFLSPLQEQEIRVVCRAFYAVD